MSLTMPIGEELRAYRRANGLTQQKLSDQTGIDRKTIDMIENGHSQRLQTRTRIRLAAVLPDAAVLADARSRPAAPRTLRDVQALLDRLRVARQRLDMQIEAVQMTLDLLAGEETAPVSEVSDTPADEAACHCGACQGCERCHCDACGACLDEGDEVWTSDHRCLCVTCAGDTTP